jgi:hypothetical protein
MKKIILVFLACLLWTGSAFGQMVLFDDFSAGLDPAWTTGVRISWQPGGGMDNSPYVKINYLGSGTTPHVLSRTIPGIHQELYFKFNFRVVGYPSGGAKFLKVRALQDDGNYANTTWMINYNSGALKEISYGAGRMANDTQETILYNGTMKGNPGPVNILHQGGERSIPLNQWNTFEAHMRLNSNNSRDGEYRVWINDELIIHATNVVNRHNNNPLHFNWLYLGNYSHNSWITPWELHYDNVMISTERILAPPVI